jgi:ubiquinone/menaquinone biosynthesis C-methylase UbiE
MKSVIIQKKEQKDYSDATYIEYFKKGWKRPYPKSLIGDFIDYHQLNKAISMLPFKIKGLKVLSINCGDGFEAEYLYKKGAEVTVSDISPEAVKAAKRRCKGLKGRPADSERLPFKDNNFDLVLVRDGLHHLPHPFKGMLEMNRVGRLGFIMIEAQKSFVTNLLIKLGFALEYEVSGNYVYRFTREEIKDRMSKMGISRFSIYTLWCYHIDFLSKYIYPIFNKAIWLCFFSFIFYLFNYIFGYYGNSMIVVALKDKLNDK